MRAKRGQVNEVDERSGLDHFAVGRDDGFLAGDHRRGDQRNGQRHYDVCGLREEQYPARGKKNKIHK